MSEDYLKTLMTTRNRQRGTGGERARHLLPWVPFRSSLRLLSLTDSLVGSFKQSAKTDSFDAIWMLITSHLALTWRGGGLIHSIGSCVYTAPTPEHAGLASCPGKAYIPLRGSALPSRECIQPPSPLSFCNVLGPFYSRLLHVQRSLTISPPHHLDTKTPFAVGKMDPLSITTSAVALIEAAGFVSSAFALPPPPPPLPSLMANDPLTTPATDRHDHLQIRAIDPDCGCPHYWPL